MDDIEDKIKQYFQKQELEEVPNLSESQIKQIHNKILENKKNNIRLFKPILIGFCLVLLIIPCLLIPILTLNKSETPPERYYTDSTAIQKTLTSDFAISYINQNYPKYNFIFSDCQTSIALGYYDENENLLALEFSLIKNDPPFSDIKFVLVEQDTFNYSDHKNFINTDDVSNTENYVLYKTINEIFYDTSIYGLLDYQNYNLYITVNRGDFDLFEKFL